MSGHGGGSDRGRGRGRGRGSTGGGYGGDGQGHSRGGGGGAGSGGARSGTSYGGGGGQGSHSHQTGGYSGDQGQHGRGGCGGSGTGGGGGYRGRGGFAGGGRGRATVSPALYNLPVPVTKNILQEAPLAWQAIKVRDSKNHPVPPPSKGPGVEHQRLIRITLNSLPCQLVLTDRILHYEIDIDLSPEDKADKANRKKQASGSKGPSRGPPRATGDKNPPPPNLWKRIVKVLIPILEQSNRGIRLPTDYMKSIFTTFQLELQDEYRIPLSAVEDEGNSTAVYVCKITEVGSVNTGVLQRCYSDHLY